MCPALWKLKPRCAALWRGAEEMSELKPFAMPKWGIEMSEGVLAQWRVQEGKPFAKGDVIALIETDKITNEVEAESDGCLVRLIAKEQEIYPVGALLGVYGPEGTKADAIEAFIQSYAPPSSSAAAEKEDAAPAPAARLETASAISALQQSKIADDVAISPAARQAAQAAGLSVEAIEATGRKGRITKQDVDKALASKAAPMLVGPIDAPGQEDVFATPLARRLAVQNGINLKTIAGSGPKGRVRKSDVLALVTQSAAPMRSGATVDIIPMSPMRKTIARRLSEAKQAIPHIYLRRTVRVDRLMALRLAAGKPGSINDYFIRACALALREVPAVNVQVHADAIHRFAHADIAMAVSTPKGLITPIIASAQMLSVAQIAKRTADLAARARSGKLQAEEYQGGSFSISNLGAYGVQDFDAIINPPQGAILAIGAAKPEPIADDGALRIVPVIHLSLSCDHRAIDGVDGAQFLEALCALIEAPERL